MHHSTIFNLYEALCYLHVTYRLAPTHTPGWRKPIWRGSEGPTREGYSSGTRNFTFIRLSTLQTPRDRPPARPRSSLLFLLPYTRPHRPSRNELLDDHRDRNLYIE